MPLCKIPFIVVKYTPPVPKQKPGAAKQETRQPYTMKSKNHLRLKSSLPMKCYGDSTVLSKLKLPKIAQGETLADVLGPFGEGIPTAFKRVGKLTKHFTDKYKQ